MKPNRQIEEKARGLRRRAERMPRGLRLGLGLLFLLAGLAGFLPVLGFWMAPLGLAILAIDIPLARRIWTWMVSIYRRHFDGRAKAKKDDETR